MSKYDVDLVAKYIVTIPDEQRVTDFYIDGSWGETFYNYTDIEDLIRHVVYAFNREDDKCKRNIIGKYINYKWIEGFPEFIQEGDQWISHTEETGKIIIELYEELDVEHITERR